MTINSPDVFDSIGDAILASGGGSSTFIGLNDTPSSYTGSGGYLAAVNSGATAIEFIDPNTVGRSTFVSLNDTPASYSGSAGQVAQVNGGATAIIFADSVKAGLIGTNLNYTMRQTAYSSTGDHEGEVIKSFGSGNQTVGDVLYWNGTNWDQADASAESTASGLISIATQTGNPADGALHQGFIQLAAAPATAGDVLYLSETAGELTATAPTTSGAIVRVMGYDMDGAGLIYFNPSPDWVEII